MIGAAFLLGIIYFIYAFIVEKIELKRIDKSQVSYAQRLYEINKKYGGRDNSYNNKSEK